MADDDSETKAIDLVQVTSKVVAAYARHNAISRSDLSGVIGAVHTALSGLGSPAEQPVARQEPSVPIRKSLSKEALICLECGRQFKSIKRHLATSHELSPDDYRARWALPWDYPMTAPAYSSTRSSLAKRSGFGRKVHRGKSAKNSAAGQQ